MKITFKSLLFLLSIVSVVSSCSKEDDKNNSIIVGKWRTYQLDEISFVLGCPDKITGNTDGEKWNSFRSKYNGKHSVEGCSYEKDVEFKSDDDSDDEDGDDDIVEWNKLRWDGTIDDDSDDDDMSWRWRWGDNR